MFNSNYTLHDQTNKNPKFGANLNKNCNSYATHSAHHIYITISDRMHNLS
uniref:Uncharacterized protein n=1 Tax=Arundo donax TaxID=35708 RepID=A0A0A9EWY5_ARUDO